MSQEIKIGDLTDSDSFLFDQTFLVERGCPVDMLPLVRRRTLKVCLVGSSRFMDTHVEVLRTLTLCGCIVLPMGLYGHWEMLDMDGPVKKMLDMLHLDKIDVSDAVFVVNPPTAARPKGYIGESTANEIRYAQENLKLIMYLNQLSQSKETYVRPGT
jgi:hypothetical protein